MTTKETKEKIKELEKLKKIPKNELTDGQKARIKQLLKELAKVILSWLLEQLTFGTVKSIKKRINKLRQKQTSQSNRKAKNKDNKKISRRT